LSRLLLAIPLFHFLATTNLCATCLAAAVLALWAFGDWLDGYLARTWDMGNQVGIVLDPLVDRISTGAALVALALFRGFPLWAAAALVAREAILVLVGVAVAVRVQRGRPSSILGKVNQWVIGGCMAAYVFEIPAAPYLLGLALAATSLTTASYAVSLARLGGRPGEAPAKPPR
jgi:phosphatidylglycerophosphate synthase